MKIFKDRKAAGKLLAKRLKKVNADLVLGIPRGGVVVAAEVAKKLKLPLDIITTRKIGSPYQKELAVGAVDADGQIYWEEETIASLELDKKQLEVEALRQLEEIERRDAIYRQGKSPFEIKDKTAILVDDGIATGATTLSAIKFLKNHGAGKIILAVPVASQSTLDQIAPEVDKLVVLHLPQNLQSVGQFYHHFEPVTDEEVKELLV